MDEVKVWLMGNMINHTVEIILLTLLRVSSCVYRDFEHFPEAVSTLVDLG